VQRRGIIRCQRVRGEAPAARPGGCHARQRSLGRDRARLALAAAAPVTRRAPQLYALESSPGGASRRTCSATSEREAAAGSQASSAARACAAAAATARSPDAAALHAAQLHAGEAEALPLSTPPSWVADNGADGDAARSDAASAGDGAGDASAAAAAVAARRLSGETSARRFA
jgi:hypothetical protein